ncbi:MAG: hypothetical protein KA369_05720 [Spirochaetes bacterium]|nr:hypothetical protein [Spirochaetota bacterium]
MKKFITIVLGIVLLFGCNDKKKLNDNLAILALLSVLSNPTSNYKVYTDISFSKVGNAVAVPNPTAKSSKMSIGNSVLPSRDVTDGLTNTIYIMGIREGAGTIMQEIKYVNNEKTVRTLIFNYGETKDYYSGLYELTNIPPYSIPTVIEKEGKKYLLFYSITVPYTLENRIEYERMFEEEREKLFHFNMWELESETETTVQYKLITTWDFSAIENYLVTLKTTYGNSIRDALVSSLDYNPARNTLYFGIRYFRRYTVGGAGKDEDAFFTSKLDGTTFSTPTKITGVIDPLNGIHYTDGITRNIEDSKIKYGTSCLSGLHLSNDGTKAYFTVLGEMCDRDYVKVNDVYYFDTTDPHYYYYPYVVVADVDVDGNITNLQRMPSEVNDKNANSLTDISNDGAYIYVGKMDMSTCSVIDDYEGMAPYEIMYGLNAVPLNSNTYWTGSICIYKYNGTKWEIADTISPVQ